MSFPLKTRMTTSKNWAQLREWWVKRVGNRFKDGLIAAKRSSFAGNPWVQEKPKAAKRGKTTSKVAKAIPTISGQESLKKCIKKRKATHSATIEATKDGATMSSTSQSLPAKQSAKQVEQSSESEEELCVAKQSRLEILKV